MHASFAIRALLILMLAGGSFADGATLKACKRACVQSVQTDCVGLRKGKLKKCRKRIWKACKRGQTSCEVIATTTTSSSSSTTAPTVTTVPTTSTSTTTTSTVPPDTITFAGTWLVTLTAISDECILGDDPPPPLEVHGSPTAARATLGSEGPAFMGAVIADGDLLLTAEFSLPERPGCTDTATFRMDGPLDVSAEMTTGNASLVETCTGGSRCETTYDCSFRRQAGD